MIVLSLEEFTAKRRTSQSDLEMALHAAVQRAVDSGTDTSGWRELLSLVRRLYADEYHSESGQPKRNPDTRWTDRLLDSLQKTKQSGDATVARIETWLATAILSEAASAAATDDPEELFLEWVDMGDSHVRDTHRAANGQRQPVGDKFKVGGAELRYPGDPTVAPELFLNCRCTVRPVPASEAIMAAAEPKNTSTVVVALPHADDPVHGVGDEQKHVTMAFLGDEVDDPTEVHKAVKGIAAKGKPFTADVSGTARLGKDKANVWMVESPDIAQHRDALTADPAISDPMSRADSHPHYVPHMTASYDPDPPDGMDDVQQVNIDRLAVWHGDEQTEYALGGDPGDDMTDEPEDDMPVDDADLDASTDDLVAQVPWHGVLAPEGVRSGDGRRFTEGSLTWRDLPLPLTWQKSSSAGHDGSVVVAKIEKIEMADGMMRASGHFIDNDEADELVGMVAEFGKFGVSVDADDSQMEVNEDDETVDFTLARVCSASVVAIPAFAEAYIALGPWDEADDTAPVEEPVAVPGETEESLAASAFAPGTEDGPGWLTNPVDTDRLRDYWVRGAGAAKIGWGAPGDFNRCRLALAKYIKPNYLAGYCANRHKDALGVWPGQEAKAADVLEMTETGDAVHLVASVGLAAPASWFADPHLAEATHLTVTDEGRVYGHIAEWGVCHIGFKGVCTEAPRSTTNYAHFLTGQVPLDNGTRAATGPITMAEDDRGGHAGPRLSARAAAAHYDNTCTAVADVTVGEDEFGIWCSGWLRPGVRPEVANALMASDVSGDWRASGNGLEMVAALACNTGGFYTPRPSLAASGQEQLSLVAAGVVHADKPTPLPVEDIDSLAEKVAAALEARQQRRERMAALAARFTKEK